MRPIDADVAKEFFCAACSTHKRYQRTIEECRNTVDSYGNGCFKMKLIDYTPTIEAEVVKHGKWLPWEVGTFCTNCTRVFDHHFEIPHQVCVKLPRCPNCGAKMDLEE